MNIIDGLALIIWLGLPSTYTLKLAFPFTLMLSSPSTVTIGTLRNISSTVLVLASGSSAIEYVSLSSSALTKGRCAVTVATPKVELYSFMYSVSVSTTRLSAANVICRRTGALPIDISSSTYFPGFEAVMLNLPSSCVVLAFSGFIDGTPSSRTVAYASG